MLITLKEAFPNAELTLSVVSNYMSGLPEDIVDNIHVAKGNDKKYGVKETYESFKNLGSQDLLFDVAMTSRSYLVTKLNPAILKIGYIQRSIYKLLYDIAIPRANYRFESEALIEQVNLFGINHAWNILKKTISL